MPGKTEWIWMGRGRNYNILQKTSYAPESKLRTKDISIEWLRSRLKNRWLKGLTIDDENGTIQFEEAGSDSTIAFGYKDNKLHFIDMEKNSEKWKVLSSINGQITFEQSTKLIDKYFDSIKIQAIENLNQLNTEWIEKVQRKVESKKSKKLKNKIKNIKNDIQKLMGYEALYIDAQNTDHLANLEEYKKNGTKVKFKKNQNKHHKADLLFSKAKAFKKALQIQQARKLNVIETLKTIEVEVDDKKALPLNWMFKSAKKQESLPEDIKVKYFENDVLKIAVGLNAKSNDYLRKAWANKDTIWAHIENVTGSHIFIKSSEVPDQNVWERLGSMLKEFSNYDPTEIHLIWTKVQYLRPVKGKAGAVRFTKEKRITVNYEREWMNLLGLRSN